MGIFSTTVTGGDAALKRLGATKTALGDLRPYWTDVFAPLYFGMVQDLFATSGTPRGPGGQFMGGPWAKLSKDYAAWKYKAFPGQPILTRTGDLRESVFWQGDRLGQGGIFNAQPRYVIFGTSVGYGKYHMTGTKHMPKRNFLPRPDPAVFGPLLHQWILKASKGA